MTTIAQTLAAQTARQREANQAQPRPARVRFNVTTTGIGETRLVGAQALDFGCYMLEEPSLTWGVAATSSLAVGTLPLCTAIVLSYVQNSQGMFTGANVAFKVQAAVANLKLRFYLTFEGSTLRSSIAGLQGVPPSRGINVFAGASTPPPSDAGA